MHIVKEAKHAPRPSATKNGNDRVTQVVVTSPSIFAAMSTNQTHKHADTDSAVRTTSMHTAMCVGQSSACMKQWEADR